MHTGRSGSVKIEDQEFQEIELKLKLHNPRLVESILHDPEIMMLSRDSKPRYKEYETIYYDTLDRHLLKEQVCYRIRNSAGEYTATIKGFGSSQNGLSLRSEWNRKLADNTPTLVPFADLSIGKVLAVTLDDEVLMPIFITRFNRIALDLFFEDGSIIELALDLGEIEAGEKKEPICEIELELKSGQVENVVKLGEYLSDNYQLKPEERSKYLRGMVLAEGCVDNLS